MRDLAKLAESVRAIIEATDLPPLPADGSESLELALRHTVLYLQAIVDKLQGTDDHPEHRCERCGGRNLHCWYADSAVWNEVAGDYNILCPICFGELASEKGLAPTAWRLSREGADEYFDARTCYSTQEAQQAAEAAERGE